MNQNQIKIGDRVLIETEVNKGTGNLTEGIVKDILTRNASHPHGIKVRLQDDEVGRVKRKAKPRHFKVQLHDAVSVADSVSVTTTKIVQPDSNSQTFRDLYQGDIPKVESTRHEFKEFYQYDNAIKNMSAGNAHQKNTIKQIKQRGKIEVARAVCSFGNDYVGGFVYLGINSDGKKTGMVQDKKLENFDDYEDKFANHLRDTLETLLGDEVFIASKLQIVFRLVENKTICIIRALPSSQPLFLNTGNSKDFFVRGPTPRAVKLEGRAQFRYIKERFPNYE